MENRTFSFDRKASDVLEILNRGGIDTTRHCYELRAIRQGDDTTGYIYKFTCPGDYLAHYSMFLHCDITDEKLLNMIYDNIEDYVRHHNDCSKDYFTEETFWNANPKTVDDMGEFAWELATEEEEDDVIMSLINLDTHEKLFEDEYCDIMSEFDTPYLDLEEGDYVLDEGSGTLKVNKSAFYDFFQDAITPSTQDSIISVTFTDEFEEPTYEYLMRSEDDDWVYMEFFR